MKTLPEVYKSDAIIAIQVLETPDNPLVNGDIMFLFVVNENNQNIIIGKETVSEDTKIQQFVGFMNESVEEVAPELRTGAKYNETVYFGFYQKSTDKLFKAAPKRIIDYATEQPVGKMVAIPLTVYQIEIDDINQEIYELYECDYYQWMHEQDPDIGDLVSVNLTETPKLTDLMPIRFQPKYVTKTTFSIVGTSLIIEGKIKPSMEDLQKGIINLVCQVEGYKDQVNIFNYKFTFPPAPKTIIPLDINSWNKFKDSIKFEKISTGFVVRSTLNPLFPEMDIRVYTKPKRIENTIMTKRVIDGNLNLLVILNETDYANSYITFSHLYSTLFHKINILEALTPPVLPPKPILELDTTPPPTKSICYDDNVYILLDGNKITIGNRTKNAMVSYTIKLKENSLNLMGGGVRSTDGKATVTLGYYNRYKGKILDFVYQTIINKTNERSEFKTISFPLL